jgi:hypothetical protein
MNGEVVEAAKAGRSHQSPFKLEDLLQGLFDFSMVSSKAQELLDEVKRDILEAAEKDYAVIKESLLELR